MSLFVGALDLSDEGRSPSDFEITYLHERPSIVIPGGQVEHRVDHRSQPAARERFRALRTDATQGRQRTSQQALDEGRLLPSVGQRECTQDCLAKRRIIFYRDSVAECRECRRDCGDGGPHICGNRKRSKGDASRCDIRRERRHLPQRGKLRARSHFERLLQTNDGSVKRTRWARGSVVRTTRHRALFALI